MKKSLQVKYKEQLILYYNINKRFLDKILEQLPDWDQKSRAIKEKLIPYIEDVNIFINQLKEYKLLLSSINLQENLEELDKYVLKKLS